MKSACFCLSFITALQKQMICSLALMGALCGAASPASATSWALRSVIPGGLLWYCPELHPSSLFPQQKLWLILVTAALSSAVPITTLITLLVTEWSCDPALGGFSPSDPAALQSSIHLVALTTRIGFFQAVQKTTFSSVSYLFCPFPPFYPGVVLWPLLFFKDLTMV